MPAACHGSGVAAADGCREPAKEAAAAAAELRRESGKDVATAAS